MKLRNETLSKLFNFLTHHEPLILLLALQLLLRVPNLFEPYWYGDEGIYLAIGNGMRHGLRLYSEIIDHKTPIIYYLAMVPSQFLFRLLTMFWMSVSTVLFYSISHKLRFSPLQTFLATFLFMLFTTLPWLEGNIPNGELFVIGFSLAGFRLFQSTDLFKQYIEEHIYKQSKKEMLLLLSSGFLFGLAILTKVPALFEIVPLAMLGWFVLLSTWSKKRITNQIIPVGFAWGWFGLGIVLPIVMSILYFYARGSLPDYLNFGLLYNFRYAGNWGLPFSQPWLVWLFSLKGKALILFTGLILSVVSGKYLRPQTKLLSVWFLASLFASVLSSRPYPHYILQIVPSASLLIIWITFQKKKMYLDRSVGILCFILLFGVLQLLNFNYYKTVPYYRNFYQYLTKQISEDEYESKFDSLMSDNDLIAREIVKSSQKRFFIWGTNPTLYALTRKAPVGRFTVSFHIKDFEGAFQETYQSITEYQPEHIVVMKNEQHPFPEFYSYLDTYYRPILEVDHMVLYQRTSIELN